MTFDCGLSLLFLMNRQRYRLITEPRRRRRRFGDDGGGRGRSTLRSSSLSGTGSERRKEREISLVQVSGELELKDSSNEIVCKPPSLPLSLPLLRWPATRADSGSAVMQWDGRTRTGEFHSLQMRLSQRDYARCSLRASCQSVTYDFFFRIISVSLVFSEPPPDKKAGQF